MTSTFVPENIAKQQPIAGSRLFFQGHSARIIDAVLMGCVVIRTEASFLSVQVPVAQVALIVLLFFAIFRRPTRSFESTRWYPLVVALMLVFLTAVSIVQDVDFVRRLGNIALLMTVAGFMASGRIDVGSAIKGIAAALTINLVLFYVGIAPDSYGGVLTGYVGDKNAAGLMYGIVAILLSLTAQRVWMRLLILGAGAGALVLTDSRTSMAAYAAAAIWIFVAPWLGTLFKALLAGGLVAAFFWADENLADFGDYAVTRAGSDDLRQRIDDAANAKLDATPWYGAGLGEATAEVDGAFWFFHNSYNALQVEGGIVALVGIVALYIVVGFGFLTKSKSSRAITTVGAATLFLLLAANRLGEVFFAPIGLVLLGVGLALIVEHDPFAPDPHLHPAAGRTL